MLFILSFGVTAFILHAGDPPIHFLGLEQVTLALIYLAAQVFLDLLISPGCNLQHVGDSTCCGFALIWVLLNGFGSHIHVPSGCSEHTGFTFLNSHRSALCSHRKTFNLLDVDIP